MTKVRFQPLRIKQSKVGEAYRNEQATAWLNYQSYRLFKDVKNVHMTRNYDEHNPKVAITEFAADILFRKRAHPKETFEEVCTGTQKQEKHEVLLTSLTNPKYFVSVSKSALALIKKVTRVRKKSKNTIIFLKISEDGHYFSALYFPFQQKRLELFDAGGSSLDIEEMKQIQYDVFHYLFGIHYNHPRHVNKLIIVSKLGYQQSHFDEYCQTWPYLYLYKRVFCQYSLSEWHTFMLQYIIQNNENVKEKANVGFDGTETTNPNRKKLLLMTAFRDWFLHTDLSQNKIMDNICFKKMNQI